MYIEKEKNLKTSRYNIVFDSFQEMEKEIATLGDFIKFHKFSIFVEDEYNSDCVATDFCNVILVDRYLGKAVAKVLSNNQISFRYFD